jgi:hypothetical protein
MDRTTWPSDRSPLGEWSDTPIPHTALTSSGRTSGRRAPIETLDHANALVGPRRRSQSRGGIQASRAPNVTVLLTVVGLKVGREHREPLSMKPARPTRPVRSHAVKSPRRCARDRR